MKKPIVLAILDGLGLRDEIKGNGYKQARTPNFDHLLKKYPNAILGASGIAVGLPEGQIGNSEVGHLNIGAGEIVYTGLSLIKKELESGNFINNKAFNESIAFAKKNNASIQVVGMLSPGGVHSDEMHLFEILKILKQKQISKVALHLFADGRDVAPRSVKLSLARLLKITNEYDYEIASFGGRLYGMDRDRNFDKTEIAFEAMQGRCDRTFKDIMQYVDNQYEKENHNDEFINVAINKKTSNFYKEGDAVIFFNFRPDRARQLAHFVIGSKLYNNQPQNPIKKTHLTTMMKYEGIEKAIVAFDSQKIANTLGSVVANAGLKQLRIAETQKYAHVTFFIDGGIDTMYKNEDRVMIDSIKIDNFAKAPLMSAKSITNKIIEVASNYDLVIVNYANADMVGHTGDLEATKIAISFLDKQIGRLKKAIDHLGGTLFITADHGNAEITQDENQKPATKHTTSDVFLIASDQSIKLKNGVLANVTPTLLDYMKLKKPATMTHKSLIAKD